MAYGAQDAILADVLEVDSRLRAAERKAAWGRGLGTAGQILAAGLAVVSALWIGGNAVADGRIGGRTLAVLVLTPLALHEVFGAFTGAAQTHTRAKAALLRVVEVLDAPQVGTGDSPTAGASEEEPSLVIDGLTVGWPGAHPVLSDVNLTVAAGESVAVVGRSGIGKTTLALGRAGLTIPPERVVAEDGGTLSGGEAQRLALARVLVNHDTSEDPSAHDVLILDEPSEHLDVETATAIMDDLWASTPKAAKLVITHDPAVMARCDRVWDVG